MSNKVINIAPLVIVRSLVYNHEPYLRQCLDGFVMQKTTFKFEVQVHDDASTDKSADIILEYANKYPNLIKPFIEEENQYSKGNAGKWKWGELNCKYIALCEGDDYWTDPYKLQKQVDYLESHLDCTMACSRTKLYSERDKRFIGENYCYRHNAVVKAKDVINRSGLFISTCSIVYRKSLLEDYPSYCYNCVVGDYPLQIMAAMKGYIYYFNDIMSVYRINNSNSWMSNQSWSSVTDSNLKRISSMINMFDGFSQTYLKHRLTFKNKIASYLISQCPSKSDNEGREYYLYKQHFSSYYDAFPVFWKLVDILKSVDVPKVRGAISLSLSYLFKCYSDQRLMYK